MFPLYSRKNENPAMASESCCPRSNEEQLYMLELLVHRLNLTTDKIQEIGSKPLTLKLEFLDFPAFEINEDEFWSSQKRSQKQTTLSNERKSRDGSLDFSAGKSCLFPKRPEELIEAMRSKPLKIGVYKTTVKEVCSREEGGNSAVCRSDVPLSGCLCDQVSMSMNDSARLPAPYTTKNTWNLIDDQGKPSGTILLFLRLTCLGKSIVTQFALKNESFLFKTSNSSNEFQCSRVPAEDGGDGMNKLSDAIPDWSTRRKPEVDSSPGAKSVIGLASVCQELAERDGGPSELVPPLKLSTNRLVEERSARKGDFSRKPRINDEDRACPSEGQIAKKIDRGFPCGRDNDTGGLCIGPENPLSSVAASRIAPRLNPSRTGSYCIETPASYLYKPRMRGGGFWDEETREKVDECGVSENYRPKYREQRNARYAAQSVDDLVSGACRSTNRSEKKSGCGCYGKLGTGATGASNFTKMRMDPGCENEPCQGIDCLIQAFKETEDFVESIGKVPGLAGLGLMDPSESPYFGREKEDFPTSCGAKIPTVYSPAKSAPSQHLQQQHQNSRQLQHSHHPRRHSLGKLDDKSMPVASNAQTHRDHNIHQSDGTSLIQGKTKKKAEEKSEKQRDPRESVNHPATLTTEASPCGKTSCKSKKKDKSSDDEESKEKSAANPAPEETTKKRASKSLNPPITKHRRKSGSLTLPGPAGDRSNSHRNSHIRVSKGIMRLVNAYGATKFCHGHKNCLDVRLRVPGNMGWLWNLYESPCCLRTPLGWKPGAISKFVWERLQQAKQMKSVETTSSTGEIRSSGPGGKGKKNRSMKSKSFHTLGRSQWAKNRMNELHENEIELPPTLHIHRKDGTYYVTMYPVKAEGTGNDTEPVESAKPLQFKITKNRDRENPDSSSTGSDMEIEFSPPAAVDRYAKKEPVKHQDTQVNQQEIIDTLKPPTAKLQTKTKKVKHRK